MELTTSTAAAPASATECLNCRSPLSGPFCGQCGQRAIPAYPTLRELLGDAWRELSGYDGRVVRTFRALLSAPGALTVEVLEGHRARYVSPIRVYLVASVVYFLIAAGTPNLGDPKSPSPGPNVTIDLRNPEAAMAQLTPEKRAELQASVDRTVWWMRPVMRAAVADPAGFNQRVMGYLPRTFFLLVPVFAGIVALFHRTRAFSQHLIFALHLHAVVFLTQALSEGADYTYSTPISEAVGFLVGLFTIAYALLAYRRVYGERWTKVVAKSMAIAVVYAVVGIAAVLATLAAVSLT